MVTLQRTDGLAIDLLTAMERRPWFLAASIREERALAETERRRYVVERALEETEQRQRHQFERS